MKNKNKKYKIINKTIIHNNQINHFKLVVHKIIINKKSHQM